MLEHVGSHALDCRGTFFSGGSVLKLEKSYATCTENSSSLCVTKSGVRHPGQRKRDRKKENTLSMHIQYLVQVDVTVTTHFR